ncbi:hypothetical protein RUND412_002432 [Rhizina undulata]
MTQKSPYQRADYQMVLVGDTTPAPLKKNRAMNDYVIVKLNTVMIVQGGGIGGTVTTETEKIMPEENLASHDAHHPKKEKERVQTGDHRKTTCLQKMFLISTHKNAYVAKKIENGANMRAANANYSGPTCKCRLNDFIKMHRQSESKKRQTTGIEEEVNKFYIDMQELVSRQECKSQDKIVPSKAISK